MKKRLLDVLLLPVVLPLMLVGFIGAFLLLVARMTLNTLDAVTRKAAR